MRREIVRFYAFGHLAGLSLLGQHRAASVRAVGTGRASQANSFLNEEKVRSCGKVQPRGGSEQGRRNQE
jgi:hypothetical protein